MHEWVRDVWVDQGGVVVVKVPSWSVEAFTLYSAPVPIMVILMSPCTRFPITILLPCPIAVLLPYPIPDHSIVTVSDTAMSAHSMSSPACNSHHAQSWGCCRVPDSQSWYCYRVQHYKNTVIGNRVHGWNTMTRNQVYG